MNQGISGNFVRKNLFAKYRLLWHPIVIYTMYIEMNLGISGHSFREKKIALRKRISYEVEHLYIFDMKQMSTKINPEISLAMKSNIYIYIYLIWSIITQSCIQEYREIFLKKPPHLRNILCFNKFEQIYIYIYITNVDFNESSSLINFTWIKYTHKSEIWNKIHVIKF